MKQQTLALVFVLVWTGILNGQDEERPTNPLPGVGKAVETIDEVDQQYREREAEVIEAEAADGAEDEANEPEEVEGDEGEASSEEVEVEIDAMPEGEEPEATDEAEGAKAEEEAMAEAEAIEERPDEEAGESVGEGEGTELESVVSPTVEEAMAEPDLPEEPVFEIPEEEVFLDLPGADSESTAMTAGAETISVDFPQEDVREIIRSVADLYELNVVIPETLTGSVSVKLRDVTWEQVFDVVLEPLNFTYVVDGNIIKILSRDELATEPVDTRVFIVDFANAGDIQNSLQPLVDGSVGGRIQVDNRSNALVITERPSRMNSIQEIIERLDRPTEQVMIESKFIEITGRDQRDLGVDWQSLAGYAVNAGPFQREYSDSDGRTSTYEQESGYEFDSGTLTQTDVDNLQRIWSGELTRTDTALFSADTFSTVISALESLTDVQLVSNPTVVTTNNSAATINIGEEYPIPSYTYNDERGTFEIQNFEFKNIGINLAVTPQINSAGFINLNIEPEISTRTGEVAFGGASGATIPIITTRKTESTVTIKSGYTLAIGGLIETRDELSSSKVPLLGDIPGLKRMFSSESKEMERRNLIVFITAKILSASGATYRDVFSQHTLHEMGIKARDLPGFEPPPAEKELFDAIQAARDEIQRIELEGRLQEQLDDLNEVKEKEAEKVERQRRKQGGVE